MNSTAKCTLGALFTALLACGAGAAATHTVTVKNGQLLKDGKPSRAVGVNYFSAFHTVLLRTNDAELQASFAELARFKIPFARVCFGGFWPAEWKLYQTDKEEYFRRMDAVVKAAERQNVGLIPSLFWNYATFCDLVGEPCDQWGNQTSKTIAFMRRYTEEVVKRYRDSKAIWAWEFGNELNDMADLPNAAEHRPPIVPDLGTPSTRSARDELTHEMIVSALREFALQVRKLDSHRPISTGNDIPRLSAWHQRADKSWQKDTPEQAAQMLAEQNPEPVDLICIHTYEDALSRLPALAAAARKTGKPLFIGEFGVRGNTPAAKEQFAAYMSAIEQSGASLAAVWNFGGKNDPFDISEAGERAWQLAAVRDANARMRATAAPFLGESGQSGGLYTYTLSQDGTAEAYDEALAGACLQGIINRKSPQVYLLSRKNTRPQYWLELLSKEGRWLEGREVKILPDLGALVGLAGTRLKGAVIWDPAVPATVNVATTIAGVEDAVVLSPDFARRYLPEWHLKVIRDLRGAFTGKETGSAKNDAYRWTLREYLAKGRCSAHLVCLFEDSFSTRAHGDRAYVVTRDWAIKNRAFVFDLSPWGDEKPADDPGQRLGLDLETYKLTLDEVLRHAAGKQMTELTGFFAFSKYSNMPGHKSAHDPVPTEWETVWLISPYNLYQNTVSGDCFNQSFHSQAPRHPLHQQHTAKSVPLEKKTYVCILMADYDSATPLYDFLPNHWHNASRGKLPLAWGINPNLLETYPDLIAYFYQTASPEDTFTSDASAAGYMNPNRVRKEFLPLFVRHNQRFFREADMTLAPMVLDWDQPSREVKDAFRQFAQDGFATIVMDLHGKGGKLPEPQVWKGMPMLELINNACNFAGTEQTADIMSRAITERGSKVPGFYFFRVVWVNPANIADTFEALRRKRPELQLELLDPYTFFGLFKNFKEQQMLD